MDATHRAAARRLRRLEHDVAVSVTDIFLARHPEFVARYGDRARTAGIEDAQFHVQFLAAAIESGSPAGFADYVEWTTRVLESRGIGRELLHENLLQVRDAVAAGLPEEEREILSRFFVLPDGSSPVPSVESDEGPLAVTRRMFVQAAIRGDRRTALTVAREALRADTPIDDLYCSVFQDALYEVGRLWERNVITVAQEHMATVVAQFVMAQVFEQLERPEATRGSMILTGVPGEMHHVGALMVADMLEAQGWAMRFLGSNVPVASIVSTVQEARPDVLGISVTMQFNRHHAERLIETVRQLPRPPRIIVGGAAFRAARHWQSVGADGYAADVKSAVALLCG